MSRNMALGIVLAILLIGGGLVFLGGNEIPEENMLPPDRQLQQQDAAPVGESVSQSRLADETDRSKTTPERPGFDIVRVEPDGRAVLAGRAPPGAEVSVYNGETLIGKVEANAKGEWVWVPDEPFPPGQLELTLRTAQGMESLDVVLMMLPERGGDKNPLVVKLDRAGQSPSRLMQLPSGQSGAVDLSLDTVDYDDNGIVVFSGRAVPGSRVRVTLDDTPLGDIATDKDGNWVLSPRQPVAPGDYRLAIDRLDAGGQSVDRLELPFRRARNEQITDAGGDSRNWIVQPGNSLWRIARRIYGQGTRFTVIYEANQEEISDPDLIYPGQIFKTPPPTSDIPSRP